VIPFEVALLSTSLHDALRRIHVDYDRNFTFFRFSDL